jgi:hypothetical protein
MEKCCKTCAAFLPPPPDDERSDVIYGKIGRCGLADRMLQAIYGNIFSSRPKSWPNAFYVESVCMYELSGKNCEAYQALAGGEE